jgi:hypothetical protein
VLFACTRIAKFSFVKEAVQFLSSVVTASRSDPFLLEQQHHIQHYHYIIHNNRHLLNAAFKKSIHIRTTAVTITITATDPNKEKKRRMSSSCAISHDLLKKQNAETSSAIIAHFAAKGAHFARLSKYEGDLTVQRDKEDDEKLQLGIDFAKKKGVIDPNYIPEPYVTIDVLGKTPAQVADVILDHVKKAGDGDSSEKSSSSGVIVLVGLSGTGKGTTVEVLRQKLEASEGSDGKQQEVVMWSNGNVFRSVTLLAATWCQQQDGIEGFDAEKALTKENLASFMAMLTFGKFNNGKYDTRICGLGLDMFVSNVQNTELKSPLVSKNIPTVAEFTQGEVILFAAKAVETMGQDGIYVLLEGREQTVNYVRSPFRFNLVLSDESLIGKRRAAQRLMADALKALDGDADAVVDEAMIEKALDAALEKMVAEIDSSSS